MEAHSLLYTGFVGVCVRACLAANFFGGHTFVCTGVCKRQLRAKHHHYPRVCFFSLPPSPTSLTSFRLAKNHVNVAPPGISRFLIAYWQLWALTCCLPKPAATPPVSLYTVLAAVVGTFITAGASTRASKVGFSPHLGSHFSS